MPTALPVPAASQAGGHTNKGLPAVAAVFWLRALSAAAPVKQRRMGAAAAALPCGAQLYIRTVGLEPDD